MRTHNFPAPALVRGATMAGICVGSFLSLSVQAALKDVAHPFILLTPTQAQQLRTKIDTNETTKRLFTQAVTNGTGRGETFRNIYKYQVLGDKKAGENEKKYLLGIIGKTPQDFEKLEHGGRHYDCYLDALRYDAVYDLLTPEERTKIEDTFRVAIDYQLTDTKVYTRTSWLPNMQWPRVMSAHIMAVALKDDARLQKLINGNGGFKWYFDSYVTPEGFYMEEFGKHYSMIGEILIFAQGMERLGLNDQAFGYTGKGGATIRKYLESILAVGYPRIEIPGGMPHYGKVTMGDARSNGFSGAPPYVFQHAIITGFLPGGAGGNEVWTGANMNGRDHKNTRVDKLNTPQWFEFAHQRWPDAGFGYFLAQMRKPGQSVYEPTMLWSSDPVDPKTVTAPAAPSYVTTERSLAMLRAEESPAYWESPAPAVALQFASYYVHYTHDCFSLLGMVAYNRPIYYNRQISDGYGGNDPYTDSVRGSCGVVVDNAQARNVDSGDEGAKNQTVRSHFGPVAKFTAVQATGVYPGVTQQRALFLTKEYLFDVSNLSSVTPRKYEWQVHALGLPMASDGWAASTDLDGGKLYVGGINEAKALGDPERYDLKNVVKRTLSDQPWSTGIVQDCAIAPEQSLLGKAWYDRKVGVQVSMLPAANTVAYLGRTAEFARKPNAEPGKGERASASNEIGGTTLLVRRENVKDTVFAALHEPFEKGTPKLTGFSRLAQDEHGLAVTITGPAFSDRILLALDGKNTNPITLAGAGESFTFTGQTHLRITPDAITIAGNLTALTLKVTGTPKVTLNGKPITPTITGGVLTIKP